MKKTKLEMGREATDKITGFKGTITGICRYITRLLAARQALPSRLEGVPYPCSSRPIRNGAGGQGRALLQLANQTVDGWKGASRIGLVTHDG